MPLKNNPGMNRLANVLSGRMKREMHSAVDLPFDFGTIGKDMGLVTDVYPEVIPKGEYLVCRSITGYTLGTSESSWIEHLQEDKHIHSIPSGVTGHSHDVPMPKLKEGDRVLVAWVADDAVVVDVIEET